MNIWQAIFLGLVQGVTEFLPVSSSGHLVLMREIFGISIDNAMFFDCMLHLGTLIAVVAVLYKEIWALIYPRLSKRILYLIIATVPAVVVAFLLGDSIDAFFEGGKFLPFFFLATAVLLLITDIIAKKERKPKLLGYRASAVMGAAQGLAILPGISRSGSTICAGVLYGADRAEAANFSFLMSIPIILGSILLPVIKGEAAATVGAVGAFQVLCGIIAAAVSGYFSVLFMLKLIKKADLKWFSLYLGILAVIVFVNYYVVSIW